MFNAILFVILGAILASVAILSYAAIWASKAVKRGHFASARYDVKSGEWRVCGKFAGISQKLADIRAGRQPGAIKYVD